MQLLALCQGVAYLEDAVVGQTHDVARPSLVDGFLALCHELCGAGETNRLSVADVHVWRVAYELAGAYFTEGDTRAVVGVDVGCNLEDEASEFLLVGIDLALLSHYRAWCGCNLAEAIQEFLYTEVGQCRAEENGSQHGLFVVFLLEGRVNALYHLQVLAQFLCIGIAYPLVQFVALYVYLHLLGYLLFVGLEKVQVLLVDIVHALEALSLVDGPR